MNSETSSSRVRSVEISLLNMTSGKELARRGAKPYPWRDVPDPYYGAFDLLMTGVPHPGAIATGISRFSSISEVFRAILDTVIVIDFHHHDGGQSILIKPNAPRKVFTVEDIYSYYGIRAHIQAHQYYYEKGLSKRPFRFGGKRECLSWREEAYFAACI